MFDIHSSRTLSTLKATLIPCSVFRNNFICYNFVRTWLAFSSVYWPTFNISYTFSSSINLYLFENTSDICLADLISVSSVIHNIHVSLRKIKKCCGCLVCVWLTFLSYKTVCLSVSPWVKDPIINLLVKWPWFKP